MSQYMLTPVASKVCPNCQQPFRYRIKRRSPGAPSEPWDAIEDRPHDCHRIPLDMPAASTVPPVPKAWAPVPVAGSTYPIPTADPSAMTIPPVPAPVPVPPAGSLLDSGSLDGLVGQTVDQFMQDYGGNPLSDPKIAAFASLVWGLIEPQVTATVSLHVADYLAQSNGITTRGPNPEPTIVIHQFQPPIPPAAAPGTQAPGPEICHLQFPRLLHALSLPKTPGYCGVWLIGPSRAGKSHAFRQAIRALGYQQHEEMSLTRGMMPSSILGFMSPQLSGAPLYVSTAYRRCWQNGWPLLLDEIDKAQGETLATIQAGLDTNAMAFPDGMIPRHPGFKLVIGSPTAGLGPSQAYPSSLPLPVDFRARFLRIPWPIDEGMELQVSLTINPTCKPWVSWVQAARRLVEGSMAGKLVITPGATYQGAMLLASMPPGLTLEAMAKEVLGAEWEMDKATWQRLMKELPLPRIETGAMYVVPPATMQWLERYSNQIPFKGSKQLQTFDLKV